MKTEQRGTRAFQLTRKFKATDSLYRDFHI